MERLRCKTTALNGWFFFGMVFLATIAGCYVPLHSPATPANQLPPEFRTPQRSNSARLNLSNLTVPPAADYILGPNDVLEFTIPGLFDGAEVRPIRAQIMADQRVTLPLVGMVAVGNMNLAQAQMAVSNAYSQGFLVKPRVSVILAQKDTASITVLGEVNTPGVYALPKYENDIGHALASAGGLSEYAAEVVEVHRKLTPQESAALAPPDTEGYPLTTRHPQQTVLRIPLRGGAPTLHYDCDGVDVRDVLSPVDVTLRSGDVVLVPRQQDEVFFVVGPLSRSNVVNFSVRERDRQLGNAFLLPQDRDIDAVTAVAMAGYIDPIDSPSTVTVHRITHGGPPLLVHVDLIKARYDWNENIYVQPGDIIYLNPDAAWWTRRTFDRIIPTLLTAPYVEAMRLWINPRSNR